MNSLNKLLNKTSSKTQVVNDNFDDNFDVLGIPNKNYVVKNFDQAKCNQNKPV